MRDIALRLEAKEIVGSTSPDETRLLFEVTAQAAMARNRILIPQDKNLRYPVLDTDRITKLTAKQTSTNLYGAVVPHAEEVRNKSGILVIKAANLDAIPEAAVRLATASERLEVATFIGVEAVHLALECFDEIGLAQAHFIGRVAGATLATLCTPPQQERSNRL